MGRRKRRFCSGSRHSRRHEGALGQALKGCAPAQGGEALGAAARMHFDVMKGDRGGHGTDVGLRGRERKARSRSRFHER